MKTWFFVLIATLFLTPIASADSGAMIVGGLPTFWFVFDGTLTLNDAGTRQGLQEVPDSSPIPFCTTIYVAENVKEKPNPNRVYIGIRLLAKTCPLPAKPDELNIFLENLLLEEGQGWQLNKDLLDSLIAAGRKSVLLPAPEIVKALILSETAVKQKGKLSMVWGKMKSK